MSTPGLTASAASGRRARAGRLPLAARLYLLFASLAVLLVAPTMPPFQNADEANHLYRADQISHLGLLAQRLPDGQQGGWIDAGLPKAAARFSAIPFHVDRKVSRGMYRPEAWGTQIQEGFPNTAIYPPSFYLPQALALAGARALHRPVLQGVLAARLATAAATILLGATAIALAGTAAPWLFSLLLLPMSLSLTAAASQDAPLLGCTALAAVLAARLRRRGSPTGLLAATLLLATVGMARPPYAGFALVLLAAQAPLRFRLAAIAAILASVLGWALLSGPHVVLPVSPAAQARGLIAAPWRLFPILIATARAHGPALLRSFIGEPGWLDVDLPKAYHALACLILAAALLLGVGGSASRRTLPTSRWRPAGWAGLFGILAAAAGVMLVQYLTWTATGAAVIEGLQGRYFIPPALMLTALARVAAAPAGWSEPLRRVVLLFPMLSLPVLLHALLLRYYF